MDGTGQGHGNPIVEKLERRIHYAAAALDPSFGNGGAVSGYSSIQGGLGHAVVIQPDGRILIAGQSADDQGVPPAVLTSPSHLAIVRLNSDGSLDPSFGTAGRSIQTVGGTDEGITSLALQPDGKILVAGFSNGVFLARFNSNGSFDTSFGSGGFLMSPFEDAGNHAAALALEPDGKIVLVGTRAVGNQTTFGVAQYSPSGVLDSSFGSGGIVQGLPVSTPTNFDGATSVAIQRDGRIVVGGQVDDVTPAMIRVSSSGELDNSFGTHGILRVINIKNQSSIDGLAIAPDGEIFGTGTDGQRLFVAGLTPDGRVDRRFGRAGIAGTTLPDFAYAGVKPINAAQAAEFAQNDNASARAIAIQRDGKIIVVGGVFASEGGMVQSFEHFAVVRFTSSGHLDPAFGSGGKISTGTGNIWYGQTDEANAVAIDASGRIVAAGLGRSPSNSQIYPDPDSQFLAVRYTRSGQLDVTFGDGGRVGQDPYGLLQGASVVALQQDGRAVVASDPYTLTRFTASGWLDPTFGFHGRVLPVTESSDNASLDNIVSTILVQPDGRILVGGGTTQQDGTERSTLVRYNANGTRDKSFGRGGVVLVPLNADPRLMESASVNAVALQADGKIVVAESLNTNNGFTLTRYNQNGTLDRSFGTRGIDDLSPIGGAANTATSLITRPDGHIVLGGWASDQTGNYSGFVIAGINPDGSLDTSFGTQGSTITAVPGAYMSTMRLLNSGTLVAAGYTSSGFAVAHYDISGRPVATFGTGGLITVALSHGLTPMAIGDDGSILTVDDNSNVLSNYSAAGVANSIFGTVSFVPPGDYSTARDVAIGADGAIYLATTGGLATLVRIKA